MTSPLQKALHLSFLSRCFAYPNEAFTPALAEALEKIETNRKELQALISAFEQERPEALQAEYTSLFLNGYPHTICPPYESVYLEKRMHGEAAVRVTAAYTEWKITVEPGLIDHIATELEFLAFLASAESLDNAMSKEARKAFETFMHQHLCRWVPQFSTDLKTGATLEPYRQLGTLMTSLLNDNCPTP